MINPFYLVPRIGLVAYLNTPKSACSSILQALARMRAETGFAPPTELLPDGSDPIHGFHPSHRHLELFLTRVPVNGPPLPAGLNRFTFVRNPYRRLYSFYKSKVLAWQNPAPEYERFGLRRGMPFDAFVRRLVQIDPTLLEHHAAPQSLIIADGGTPRVEFVGRVESLATDWEVIQQLTGFAVPLPHANAFKDGGGPVYTAALRDLVYQYYRNDFDLFGYERESIDVLPGGSDEAEVRIFAEPMSPDTRDALRRYFAEQSAATRERAAAWSATPTLREDAHAVQQELLNELILKRHWQTQERLDRQQQELASLRRLTNELQQHLNRVSRTLDRTNQRQQELSLSLFRRARQGLRLQRLWRALVLDEVALLRRSGCFDEAWYLETYPDVAESGMDPVQHYVEFGVAQARNPSPQFDTTSYLAANPTLVAEGMNPLIHKILKEPEMLGAFEASALQVERRLRDGISRSRRAASHAAIRLRRLFIR